MSHISDSVAFGAAMLSGAVVMAFGAAMYYGIKTAVEEYRKRNHQMAVRNSK